MNLRSLIKSIKLGFSLVKEAPVIFLTSTSLITLCALFLWFSIFASYFLNQTVNYLKNKINFSIYFTQNTDREEILKLQKILQEFPNVENVLFVSREESLENLKKSVGYSSVLQKALEAIKVNPLSDYLVVNAKDPSVYSEITDYLMQSKFKPKIEFLTYFENQRAIQKLINLTRISKLLIYFLLASILFLTAVLIFHLATLVIFAQKETIEIFKLLGATRNFIRTPFYVLAIIASFLGGLIALSLVMLVLKFTQNIWVYVFASLTPNEFLRYHFLPLNFFVFGVLILTALIATRFALRKYLKH